MLTILVAIYRQIIIKVIAAIYYARVFGNNNKNTRISLLQLRFYQVYPESCHGQKAERNNGNMEYKLYVFSSMIGITHESKNNLNNLITFQIQLT